VRFRLPKAVVLASVGLLVVGAGTVITLELTRDLSGVTPTATQGNISLAASPDPVQAGEVVKIDWSIRGPIRVVSTCENPNPEIWAISPDGSRLPLTHAALCQSGTEADVADGQSLTRSIYWQTSGLGPGLYSIHGRLTGVPTLFFSNENFPVVTVQLTR
jgi:hypothetical protein